MDDLDYDIFSMIFQKFKPLTDIEDNYEGEVFSGDARIENKNRMVY